MLKKILFTSALVISSSAVANIKVNVENDSNNYDVVLTSKDVQTSTYSPDPQATLAANSADRFSVYSNYPDVVRLVDLEYKFSDSSVGRCFLNN